MFFNHGELYYVVMFQVRSYEKFKIQILPKYKQKNTIHLLYKEVAFINLFLHF